MEYLKLGDGRPLVPQFPLAEPAYFLCLVGGTILGFSCLLAPFSSNPQQSLQQGIGGKKRWATLKSLRGPHLPQSLQTKALFQGTLPLAKRPPLSLCSAILVPITGGRDATCPITAEAIHTGGGGFHLN